MNNTLTYILEANLVFAILYSIYYFVFRQLTFHRLNRILLLAFIPLSFVLPLVSINISPGLANEMHIPKFEEIIPVYPQNILEIPVSKNVFSYSILIYIAYISGILIYTFILLKSIFKLVKIKQRSQSFLYDGLQIVEANVPSTFSFFNWIFIPGGKLDPYTCPIIEHEKLHYKLWHSFDLILTEIFIALFWFNPFVFFYRKSIKSVHEFQVDALILKGSIKKSQYLQLMLDNICKERRLVGIYNYFNNNTIKKRINMITKNKTHRLQLSKYLVIIPTLALLSMASPKPSENKPDIYPIKKENISGITQEFGKNMKHPFTGEINFHGGIDLSAKKGIPVISTADGTVIKVIFDEAWGRLIVINHGNSFETWYAHLNDFAVKEGDEVLKEKIIGYVGNSGLSTGPHLHYEVKLNGERVNPMDYIKPID